MTTQSKQLELSLGDALALAPGLSGAQLAWLSGQTIDGPEAAAEYVRLACEATADRGAWVDADGVVHFDAAGAQVPPAQSGEHVRALGRSQGPKALKPIDKAFKDAVSAQNRQALLIRTLYARGQALSLGLGEATKVVAEAPATEGNSFDGMPPEIAEQMRKMMAEMGHSE